MTAPHIQLLTFADCPLADAARSELQAALQACGIEDYEEIDILDPSAPDDLRGWGSPTILINGVDATGQRKGDNASCRIYAGERGVLTSAEIIRQLRALRP